MTNPVDGLYERLLADWQRDPSTLDNPVLRRAFEAGVPNRELQDAHEQATRGLQVEREHANASDVARRNERHQHARDRAQLEGELVNTRRKLALLRDRTDRELTRLRADLKPAPEPVFAPGEAERLAGLGWRKGA